MYYCVSSYDMHLQTSHRPHLDGFSAITHKKLMFDNKDVQQCAWKYLDNKYMIK